jgi:hypothetical protein
MVDISIPFYTHMLYGWNIYQHLPEQNHPVLWVNIPAPWSIWVMGQTPIGKHQSSW